MMRKPKIDRARAAAAQVLAKHGCGQLPIDPFEIARKESILVEPKPASAKGVSGMLLKVGDLLTKSLSRL